MRQSIALLSILTFSDAAFAQRPRFNVSKFDSSISNRHRQDLCARQRLFFNDTINVADALKGLDLNVVLTDRSRSDDKAERYLFSLDDRGSIPREYPGIFAVLLDEVARRGKFRWRNSFGVVSPIDPKTDGNKTWTDLLVWETRNYDLAVEFYSKSVERMGLGVSFPEGWFDSSIILVELQGENGDSFNVWSFLYPFTTGVWGLIIAFILFTGIMYWLLEQLDENADARQLNDKPLGAVFLSAITFTGHFEFRPNTNVARLLSFSWSFWALITAAAYTANLASFLVQGQTAEFRITSIDQALRMHKPMCVWAKAWAETYMRNTYGEQVNLVEKDTESSLYDGLRNGECDAALVLADTHRRYERNANINSDCSLRRNGITASIIRGGFATAVDSGSYCTSLVSHVVELHMLEMEAEGFIDSAFEEYLDKISSHVCADTIDGGGEDISFRLGMKEMGGSFVFHAIMCAVSVSIGLVQFLSRHSRLCTCLDEDASLSRDEKQDVSAGFVDGDSDANVGGEESAWNKTTLGSTTWNSGMGLRKRNRMSKQASMWELKSENPSTRGFGSSFRYSDDDGVSQTMLSERGESAAFHQLKSQRLDTFKKLKYPRLDVISEDESTNRIRSSSF